MESRVSMMRVKKEKKSKNRRGAIFAGTSLDLEEYLISKIFCGEEMLGEFNGGTFQTVFI